MKSDSLLFQFFADLPNTFFRMVGRTDEDAKRYVLKAIEYKSTSVRLDGVFLPLQPSAGPAYLWETQFYQSEKFYANLWTKIGRFLEHGDPSQEWVAVAIYPSRAFEQENVGPYRSLLNSDQFIPIFLDQLPPAKADEFEFGILELITAKPQEALDKAKAMVPRVRASKRPLLNRRMLIQFIETVIVHQFPEWTHEEIENMLQVTDVRETRVFKDALEEGIVEGREKERISVASKLLAKGVSIAVIAETTGLTQAQIRKLGKKPRK